MTIYNYDFVHIRLQRVCQCVASVGLVLPFTVYFTYVRRGIRITSIERGRKPLFLEFSGREPLFLESITGILQT
jgi:hypothetical protein